MHGEEIPVPRHLVVATRVNQRNRRPENRLVQIRGWNASAPELPEPPAALRVEVASAHLFGLCWNLGLVENARALALGVEARELVGSGGPLPERMPEMIKQAGAAADEELSMSRGSRPPERADTAGGLQLRIPSRDQVVEVTVLPTTAELISQLRTARPDEAARAVDRADAQLDEIATEPAVLDRDEALLPSGILVRIPAPVFRR